MGRCNRTRTPLGAGSGGSCTGGLKIGTASAIDSWGHRGPSNRNLQADYVLCWVRITTIQVSPATRERLATLKSSPRESYSELLNKLLALMPPGDEEGTYTDLFRMGLLSARLDVRTGRTLDHEQLKKRLGF